MFTYIFCVKISDESRKKAFLFLLSYITKNTDAEVIVVEQDKESKLNLTSFKVKHIFAYNAGGFDKAWGYNIATKYATTDKLVFGDADIFIDTEHLTNSLSYLDNYDVVDPKYFVWDVNEDDTNTLIKDASFIPEKANVNVRKFVTTCGGLVIFKKSALEKIYGWTELCRGWGAEDDIQAYKTTKFLKSYHFPGRIFHLYHPSNEPVSENTAWYQKNIATLYNYRNNINSLADIADIEPKVRGDEAKYAKEKEEKKAKSEAL